MRHRMTIALVAVVLLTVGVFAQSPFSRDRDRVNPPRGPQHRLAVPLQDSTRNPDRGQYEGWTRSTKGAVRLLRAREVKQEDRGNGLVTVFDWDVKLIQDSMTVWCDRAFYWERINKLRMIGEVIMIDPVRRLDADEVVHSIKDERTEATGNVVMYRDSVRLSTERGLYQQKLKVAHVYDDMRVEDWRRDITLTGDEGIYEIEREKLEVPVNPVLVQMDSTGEVQGRITSEFMVYDGSAGFAEARDSVTIFWEELEGRCGRMFYYPDDEKALLLNKPVVWRGRDEAMGDSIWIYLDGEELDSVEVIGHSKAYTVADTSNKDTPRSVITGQRIVMDFDDGAVVRMQADDQASAVYHIFEEGKDKGSNETSGDRIVLYFKENELDHIQVTGGAKGTYFPKRLADKVRKEE